MPFGVDGAGFDDDDLDAERGDFDAQGVAESLHGELRGVVPTTKRHMDLAPD